MVRIFDKIKYGEKSELALKLDHSFINKKNENCLVSKGTIFVVIGIIGYGIDLVCSDYDIELRVLNSTIEEYFDPVKKKSYSAYEFNIKEISDAGYKKVEIIKEIRDKKERVINVGDSYYYSFQTEVAVLFDIESYEKRVSLSFKEFYFFTSASGLAQG
jgi:6-pyruvoyl-tetrahydropterin synthase